MEYLNCSIEYLEAKGGLHTAKEICSQPQLWEETYHMLNDRRKDISEFLLQVTEHDQPLIILTGAGTSSFIGESLVGSFQKNWGMPAMAISTTNIITHPENYFIKSRPTLLISFARSGDSPESVATIEMGRKHCDIFYELNITCNVNGKLAKKKFNEFSLTIVLPEDTNDTSLAMTSSYSSMLFTGLFVANFRNVEAIRPIVKKIQEFGNYILNDCLNGLKKIAEMDFKRMVFLGSGPLLGVAQESHLKVQELSDGIVICKHDSFLGFRHGPRVVVNDETIVVYLLSNNSATKPYELDLINSMKSNGVGERTIAVGCDGDLNAREFDLAIQFPEGTADIPEDFLSVFYVLPAQILGFYKSLDLGLSPDSPSKNGSISRVVQGVTIYNQT